MAKQNNPGIRAAPTQSKAAQAVAGALGPQPQQVQLTQQQHIYEGPIPPPEVLRGYEAVQPGAAERILRMAEVEAEQRQRREAGALQANIETQKRQLALAELQTKSTFRSDMIGQGCGLIVCLLSIAGAIYLGVNGHEWLGGALAGIPTAAVVKAFVIDKHSRQQKQAPSQK